MNKLKLLIIAFVGLVFVFSCKDDSKANIEFGIITVADSTQNHTNDTTLSSIISISYFDVKNKNAENSVAANIKDDFFAWLNPFLLSDENIVVTEENLKDVIAMEILAFIKDINEDESLKDCEACRHVELSIKANPAYQNKNVVSLVYTYYQYSGGAHGNYGTTAFNYKPNGTPVTLENLSSNIDELTAIAEQTFRKQNGELKEYWFDDEKFYLPDVFYFTENAIVFYYGLYEIAPYAAGDIFLELNNDDVKHLIDYIN
jgi:hypothetical protein